MTRYILIFTLAIPGFIMGYTQDTLTLEQAILTGLKNNFQIQVSQKQVRIAEYNSGWGSAGAYPTISLNATARGNHSNLVQNPVSDAKTQQTIILQPSVDLNWILFNGLRIRTTKAKLDDLLQQSEGNAAIVVENTIQSIILAYHLAKLNEETLNVTEQVLKLSQDRYNYILARKEYGNAVTFDVLQAKTNFLTDSANVIRQRINLRNAVRNLNLILAGPTEKDYFLSSEYNIEKEEVKDFQLADLIAKMESSNKTLQNQYIYQEILKKNTKINRSQLYPMLSLNLGSNLNNTGIYYEMENGTWGDSYNLYGGLMLSWTLSDGGNIRSAIQASKISEEIGQLETEEIRRSMHNQLLKTYEEYSLRRQLKQISKLNVESSGLNLQIAEEKFKSGAINSFNYRDIQIVYLNASRELLQADYELVQSFTELLRLTGGIISEYDEKETENKN